MKATDKSSTEVTNEARKREINTKEQNKNKAQTKQT
jgi:hypothetical protein